MNGILVTRVGMAREDDHNRLVSANCALISRLWIKSSDVETHAGPSAKVLSARKAARGTAKQKVVRASAESASSPLSASE